MRKMTCYLFLAWVVFFFKMYPAAGSGLPFPTQAAGYKADGAAATYDRETVYDYMDGGAEVYLEYGMKELKVQRYAKEGAPPISFGLFEMDSPDGAYGAFTFENEDEDAGVGQGSEYGGGLLRFWQGSYFGFVQAEVESPAYKEAVLSLGKAVAERLGPGGERPKVVGLLPEGGLRPRSVRFARSPLLLQVLDAAMQDNPMSLPQRCDAVIGKYGPKGSRERVVIVRCKDKAAAEKAVEGFIGKRAAGGKPSVPFESDGGWSAGAAKGEYALLVLGAPGREQVSGRLDEAISSAGRIPK